MRVLWWTYDFWPSIGGGEVIGAQLARGLEGLGHELRVVTQAAHGLARRDSFGGIPVTRFPFHTTIEDRDPGAIAGLQRELRDLVRAFRPDFVHLHTLAYPAFFCSLAIAGSPVPLLLTRHELFPEEPGVDALAPRLMERAEWIACCSEAVLGDVRHRFPQVASRSSTILNGLALPPLDPTPVPDGPPILLCVGRLTEQKGFALAIEALPVVRERFPEARLVIAGEGPAGAALNAKAARLGMAGAVELPGWIKPAEVYPAIRRATIVLVPSLGCEAFGLVALQAAQMGRPVVASRTGGLPEIVVDGETGILFEPADVAGLAAAILHLLERPELARACGRAARARALDRFTGERYLEEYDRLYRELPRRNATAAGTGHPRRDRPPEP